MAECYDEACDELERGHVYYVAAGDYPGYRFADCEIHDAADDGAVLYDLTGLRFEGNVVHALHACGNENGCGDCSNGHSDGLEMFNVEASEVRGNLIYDLRSTATVFFGNWGTPEQYNPPGRQLRSGRAPRRPQPVGRRSRRVAVARRRRRRR